MLVVNSNYCEGLWLFLHCSEQLHISSMEGFEVPFIMRKRASPTKSASTTSTQVFGEHSYGSPTMRRDHTMESLLSWLCCRVDRSKAAVPDGVPWLRLKDDEMVFINRQG